MKRFVMSFKYRLELSTPQRFAGGTNRVVNAENITLLKGLTLFSERVDPGGLREMHWHVNAHELNYCLRGQGEIGILTPDGTGVSVPIEPGSITFIPGGSAHYILNTGPETLHTLVGLSNEKELTIDFSDTYGFVPRKLLAQTFSIPTESFPQLPRQGDQFIVRFDDSEEEVDLSGPFSVNIADLPLNIFPGGSERVLTSEFIPSLEDLSLLLLEILPRALREPHWHPLAGELHYFVRGEAEMQMIGPNGRIEQFKVGPGDVAFAPENYLHYVANIADEPITIVSFFTNKEIAQIDTSQIFSFFPHDIIAASFSRDVHIFDDIPDRGDVRIAPPPVDEE